VIGATAARARTTWLRVLYVLCSSTPYIHILTAAPTGALSIPNHVDLSLLRYLTSSLNYNLACAALPISNASTPASLAERHLNSKSSKLHAGLLVDFGWPSFVVVFIYPFCACDSHH
jgi:hypothetical protein